MQKILSIIDCGEGVTTEFKKCSVDLQKDILETVCSFLNRIGGDILLGVSDDGIVVGILESEVQKIKTNLITQLNNPQKISPTIYLSIEEVIIDRKHILHIYVPEGSQVYKVNGRIYDRNEDGDFDVSNSADTVALMYIRKQNAYTENKVFPYAQLEDLKHEVFDLVRTLAVNNKPNHPWGKMSNDELLRSAGLYQTDMISGKKGYTLACILLFGKEETIRSALPHHKTDAILRKVNLDRYDDRDDIRCNLIESYERLMNFIEKHLNDIFYLENDQRVSVRNKLFREVVVNILIHREYANPFPAKLIIEKTTVKGENSNKAHGFGEIDLNEFTPFPKNPTIAGVFKEIGFADELGSGIRNMKKYCQIYSNSQPILIEGDVFKTIISIKSDDKVTIKSDDKSAKSRNHIDKILAYIEENQSITYENAMEITGLKITRVKQIVNDLVCRNILVVHGSNRKHNFKLK